MEPMTRVIVIIPDGEETLMVNERQAENIRIFLSDSPETAMLYIRSLKDAQAATEKDRQCCNHSMMEQFVKRMDRIHAEKRNQPLSIVTCMADNFVGILKASLLNGNPDTKLLSTSMMSLLVQYVGTSERRKLGTLFLCDHPIAGMIRELAKLGPSNVYAFVGDNALMAIDGESNSLAMLPLSFCDRESSHYFGATLIPFRNLESTKNYASVFDNCAIICDDHGRGFWFVLDSENCMIRPSGIGTVNFPVWDWIKEVSGNGPTDSKG